MEKLDKCSIIKAVDLDKPNAVDLDKPNIEATALNIKANIKKIFLLGIDVKETLHEVFEKISKDAKETKVNLTSGRFAYEIAFKYPTELYLKNKKVADIKRFSELLENLDYDENGYVKGNYLVVIDDKQEKEEENIQKDISTLFQQIVFLNIDIDICTKTELEIKNKKDIFRKNYETILDTVTKSFKEIEKIEKDKNIAGKNLTDKTIEKVQKIKNSLSIIKEEIEKAKARPIRIAVMGTKKAGKSVIINSILNCDYAPTSLELPTPNNIIYTPNNKDNRLCLKYKDEKIYFDTANELKKYITEEFEKAQDKTGKGSELEDMIIYYPSDTLTGFEILDTPGPNFAGAGDEHAKKTEKAIKIADVCIFVINYSTHLTNDEANYLAKIRKYFKEHDKFYSLFITVNRIDERYSTNVEKSVIRIIDYIRNRLEELKYNNISVFGTSALQSFYLEKVRQLQEKSKMKSISLSDLNLDIIDDLIEQNYEDDEKLTPLDFVANSFRQMRIFHKIKKGNGEQLNLLSGMPQLNRYCHYIGEQKADTEIVNAVLFKIGAEISSIKSKFLLEFISKIYKDLEVVEKEINELQRLADELNAVVMNIFDGFLSEIDNKISNIFYVSDLDIDRFGKDYISKNRDPFNWFLNSLKIDDKNIQKLLKGKQIEEVNSFFEKAELNFKETSEQLSTRISKSRDNIITQFSKEIVDRFNYYKSEIDSESDKIKNATGDIKLKDVITTVDFPSFPFSLEAPKIEFHQVVGTSSNLFKELETFVRDNTNIQKREYTRSIGEAWNDGADFWSSIGNVFTTVRNKVWRELLKTEKFYRDNADVESVNKKLKELISSCLDIGNESEQYFKQAKKEFQENIKKSCEHLRKQCKDAKDIYENIFSDLRSAIDDLNKIKTSNRDEIINQISILDEIRSEKLKAFFKVFTFIDTKEDK